MKTRVARRGEINGDLIDRFTLAHFASGVGLGVLGASVPLALVVGAGWEVIERPLKDAVPSAFPNATQDRLINVVGDIVAVGLGCALVAVLRRSKKR